VAVVARVREAADSSRRLRRFQGGVEVGKQRGDLGRIQHGGLDQQG